MNKIILLALLTLIIVISGCTSQEGNIIVDVPGEHKEIVYKTAEASENPCENVVCKDNTMDCGNGEMAVCENTCTEGECSDCTPACEIDEEEEILCEASVKKCEDDYIAECENVMRNGRCTNCNPECGNHGDACEEDWECEEWEECEGDYKTRDCFDMNECGTDFDKPETKIDCDAEEEEDEMNHVIFSEIYYDTEDEDSLEEWIEIYNPTDYDIDLTDWTIEDNTKDWPIPDDLVIRSHDYMTFARDKDTTYDLFGCTPIDGLTLSLSNKGDHLTLWNDQKEEIDFVAWEMGGPDNQLLYWEPEAYSGESIKRENLDEDTDTEDDWIREDDPHPNC